MSAVAVHLILAAGAIHAGIVLANIPLPGRLRVRENLAAVPKFVRQIFYVHWLYIVAVVGFFSALCFGFAPELAGATALGRSLSAFMATFWLSRLLLQWLYYDPGVRRANRGLDAIYALSLLALVGIFGWSAIRPSM